MPFPPSSPMDDSATVHPKKRRATMACVGCRIRKTRCGALPPGPCRPCLEADKECAWSSEDGRKRRKKTQVHKDDIGPSTIAHNSAYAGDPHHPTLHNPPKNRPNNLDLESWLREFTSDPNQFFKSPANANHGVPLQDDYSHHGSPPSPDTILGLTACLPVVEHDAPEPLDEPEILRVTWFRPLGPTAIAPGLKRFTLKVRRHARGNQGADATHAPRSQLFTAEGLPSPVILSHLLDLFFEHLHCMFPFFERPILDRQIADGSASALLLNSICAITARFSEHPWIAVRGVERFNRGSEFGEKAKNTFIVPMLSVPSIDGVASLMLLAYYEFGRNSEAGLWMYVGMACRMAQDLGLNLEPPPESAIGDEERRYNRLVFWSLLILDYSIAVGTGRPTTLRTDEISVVLPEPSDISLMPLPGIRLGETVAAFPYAARQMYLYGPVLNMLNGMKQRDDYASAFTQAKREFIMAYQNLPTCLVWNIDNFRTQNCLCQGPIFLQLHLMFFTIMTFAHWPNIRDITTAQRHRPSRPPIEPLSNGNASDTLSSAAKTIGEIYVLADAVDPLALMAAPFVNQALFVASCTFLRDVETYSASPDSPSSSVGAFDDPAENSQATRNARSGGDKADGPRTFLSSVAANNLSVLRQGLRNQTKYWSGVSWIEAALTQRINGVQGLDVDLSLVSAAIHTYTIVPDEGVLRQIKQRQDRNENEHSAISSSR
ncbi:hypothetical protein FISHEDRAFT_77944 [Fistulina hepatica ATCC 64428]|nr:hypothetical protein FISHEDRAFT_77944 [Fistulina hepatica ATCC 64428]